MGRPDGRTGQRGRAKGSGERPVCPGRVRGAVQRGETADLAPLTSMGSSDGRLRSSVGVCAGTEEAQKWPGPGGRRRSEIERRSNRSLSGRCSGTGPCLLPPAVAAGRAASRGRSAGAGRGPAGGPCVGARPGSLHGASPRTRGAGRPSPVTGRRPAADGRARGAIERPRRALGLCANAAGRRGPGSVRPRACPHRLRSEGAAC